MLKPYPFSTYVATYKECIDDIKAGKSDAVYYDDNFLKHEFILDKSMTSKFKVVNGNEIRFNGPYFSSTPKHPKLQSAMNSALTDIRADTEAFRTRVNIYYPNYVSSNDQASISSEPTINYFVVVPFLAFIVPYWMLAVFLKHSEGDYDSMLEYFSCCQCCLMFPTNVKDDTEEDTEEKTITVNIPSKGSGALSSASKIKIKKRGSFFVRDAELRKKKKNKKRGHGNLRTLYADGEEFVGLTNEVHSIHGSIDQLKDMMGVLMLDLENREKERTQKELEKEKEDVNEEKNNNNNNMTFDNVDTSDED